MLIIVSRDESNVEVEVDTERYKFDTSYKRRIHERLGIADYPEDLDWDTIVEMLESADDEPARRVM